MPSSTAQQTEFAEQELLILSSYLVPKGHRLRPRLLSHFSRTSIDHANPRYARSLKSSEYQRVLPHLSEICGHLLIDGLEADLAKEDILRNISVIASAARAFMGLLPLFDRTESAQEFLMKFIEKVSKKTVVRSGAAQPVLSVAGQNITAGSPPTPTATPTRVQSRKVPRSVRRSTLVTEPGHAEYYLSNYHGPLDGLSKLLHLTGQANIGEWRRELPNDAFTQIEKLGEGQFGEVFRTSYNGRPIALKVLPFANPNGGYTGQVNGEELKDAAQIIPELLISRELSNLAHGTGNQTSSYIELVGAHVVSGGYPPELLAAWDIFAQNKDSRNDRPDSYAVAGQPFLCIALAIGGNDIEAHKVEGVEEATSIVMQCMWALRIAERELRFEHRDLHVGNVLVQKTDEEYLSYLLDGKPYSIKSCGVKVNIIDFTLARMEKGSSIIYFDASVDPALFAGSTDVLQYDIYRMMREHNKNDWSTFCPKSNAFWLYYLSNMVITDAKHRQRTPKKRRHAVQRIFDRLLNYGSLDQFVREDGDFHKLMQQYVKE